MDIDTVEKSTKVVHKIRVVNKSMVKDCLMVLRVKIVDDNSSGGIGHSTMIRSHNWWTIPWYRVFFLTGPPLNLLSVGR